MIETINDDVAVTGGFTAGNWIFGSVITNPEGGSTPTFHQVTGVNPEGEGEGGAEGGLVVFTAARSSWPWARVLETAVVGETEGANIVVVQPNSWHVVITRTNTTSTEVYWMTLRSIE